MLDDRLPGIAEKRGEIAGWVEMAKAQGWYEPDDELDAQLPYLCRDLGWDDKTWRANEHSFSCCSTATSEPGMRVLEVGAAKGWAAQHLVPRGVEYVATDILADPNIGIGRGAFFESRVGPFARVQADGEHLPFADGSFDLIYCVAALHHALDLSRMVGEMARVTQARRRWSAALNEGTRAVARERGERGPGRGEGARDQRARALAVRVPVGLLAGRPRVRAGRARRGRRRPARAGGSAASCGASRSSAARLRRGSRRPVTATRACASSPGNSMRSSPSSFSVNVMTRGPGDRVAAMLALFRGIADEILVAVDDRAGPEVEAPLAAVADRMCATRTPSRSTGRSPGCTPSARGDWVLTIDDDEMPIAGAARRVARAGAGGRT